MKMILFSSSPFKFSVESYHFHFVFFEIFYYYKMG
jgi:hypothetical protein